MRVVRADDYGHQPELPWQELIRSEMDTWMPQRLPTNFRLRPRPHRRSPLQSAALRRCAVTVAIAGAAAAFVLTPMSSPVPGVVHMLLDSRTVASPVPAAPASVTRVPSGLPATTDPTQTTPSQAAQQPSAPAAHSSSRSGPSAPARPAPTGSVLGGLLPPIVSSSTAVPTPQVSVTAVADSPTPAPRSSPDRHCLLGLICV
jgi:hypothetical protein